MHADHVLGLVTILATVLSGVAVSEEYLERLKASGLNKKASSLLDELMYR